MACRLVALDKIPGVRPTGIGGTLHRALAKLVMVVAGYQAKTVCGNLHLCAGLEAGSERATHTVGQRRIERVRAIWSEEIAEGVAYDEEEESGGMAACLNNLTINTVGTEEEAAEQLEAVLDMEMEEFGEGEEGGDGIQGALGALDLLTQDADPSGTTLVDARNVFYELSRLAMMWTVRHRWPAGARFVFN